MHGCGAEVAHLQLDESPERDRWRTDPCTQKMTAVLPGPCPVVIVNHLFAVKCGQVTIGASRLEVFPGEIRKTGPLGSSETVDSPPQ